MDDFDKAFARALKFLSYRPRSEKEIRDNLAKKKFDQLIVERVIKTLKEHKFINDEEFARMWFESRANYKPRSSRIIKMELRQKGINDELIEETFSKYQNEEKTDVELAKKIAETKWKRLEKLEPQKRREKLAGFLGRKGFGWDVIKEVINEIERKD